MIRRLLIIAALLWATSWTSGFSGLHGGTHEPLTMLAFGFIVLAATTLGEVAHKLHIPHICGYLIAGLVCSDQGLGLLSVQVVEDLRIFDALAIALIALEAGATLELQGLLSRWRGVLLLSLAMIVTSLSVGGAFTAAAAGSVQAATLPFLDGAGWPMMLTFGLLLGVMVLATSPPVTLVVVNESKAEGEYTDFLLTTVILNNLQVVVLFALAMVVGQALVGDPTSAQGGAVALQLLKSVALGGLIAGVAIYTHRQLKQDAVLVLVGLCYVGTWLAGWENTDQALLLFLTAGALVNNASNQGPALKTSVATLAGPVYVLFFTLIGAQLHIDAILHFAPYAVALVLLRLGAWFVSVSAADQLVPIGDSMRSYGWLGLAPQAGIAVTIALAVGATFPGWGREFQELGLAAIAINEMVGPILLKVSLSLAGDTAAIQEKEARDSAPSPELDERPPDAPLESWLPPSLPDVDFWSPPANTGALRVDELSRDIAGELKLLVRDLQRGPIQQRRLSAHAFAQNLRREFLRIHRRSTVRARTPEIRDDELRSFLRQQLGDLALQWRGLLLERAGSAHFRDEEEALDALLHSLERIIDGQPVAVTAELTRALLEPEEGDGAWLRLQKGLQRGRLGADLLLDDGELLRVIEVRKLARYHLSGLGPEHLEEVAGLLTLCERHLLIRAHNIFGVYRRSLEGLLAEGPGDARTWRRRLGELLEEMEQEFHSFSRDIDQLADETVRVAEASLARPWRGFVDAARIAGTPALSPRQYRFSTAYKRRERAITALDEGFAAALALTRGTASRLAIELELVRLSSRIYEPLDYTTQQIVRAIRNQLVAPFERVLKAAPEAQRRLQELAEEPPPNAEALLQALEALTTPLTRILDEVVTTVELFRAEPATIAHFEALLQALDQAISQLTDRLQIVNEPTGAAGRGLPRRATPATLRFQELIRGNLKTRADQDLSVFHQHFIEQVDRAGRRIRELDRVLAFQIELIRAEVDLLSADATPAACVELLEENLLTTLGRTTEQVHALLQDSQALIEEARASLPAAVQGNLEAISESFTAGRFQDLQSRLSAPRLGRREDLQGAAAQLAAAAQGGLDLAREAAGESRVNELRRRLGLPPFSTERPLDEDRFRAPRLRVELPVAYHRLFSDATLEAGDLLTGREVQVARVRRLLSGQAEGSRAVAVISAGGMGREGVISALVRGVDDRGQLLRYRFNAPGSDEDLDAIIADAEASNGHSIIVIEGLEWLFSIQPGGFERLRKLIGVIVRTNRRVGWLISADRPVWTYADRVVALHDALPTQLDLAPLGPIELRRALIARHAMSGFQLQFARPEGARWLQERLLSGQQEQRAWERRYFESLHEASGGALSDALRLWMASILRVDTETQTILIGRPPRPSAQPLQELPEDVVIVLRQVARQGRLSPEEHAAQFRVEPIVSQAFLARLSHWGLLSATPGGWFVFQPELSGPLYRLLRERGLVG